MSIMGVLTRNEFLTMRKRRAFLVTLALFSAIALLGLGEDFVDALRESTDGYAFPNLWGEVLGEPTQIVAIFGTVALLLLISQRVRLANGPAERHRRPDARAVVLGQGDHRAPRGDGVPRPVPGDRRGLRDRRDRLRGA